MANVNPLKLVDQGSGAGALTEFGATDTLATAALANAIAVALTGLVAGTNTAIAATDTILAAMQKLQAQVAARLPLSGGTLTGPVNEAPPVTMGSGATVNIGGAAASTINITGTTTITAFDTVAAGIKRTVIFAGALTLTYNATSMQLLTGASIVTAAGDTVDFQSLGGGNWKMLDYSRASSMPLYGTLSTGALATVTKSGLDGTAGRLLRVGDYGIGGSITPYSGNIDTVAAIPFGTCYAVAGATGTKPTTQGILTTRGMLGDGMSQEWVEITGSTGTTTRRYTRDGYAAVGWGPWRQVFHAGVIVGTVGWSGGAPTGAIVETGSNANGTYTRFADGTQICEGPIADTAVGANSTTAFPTAVFPASFRDALYFTLAFSVPTVTGDVYGFTYLNTKTAGQVGFVYRNGATAQTIANIRWVAIGRWF